MALSNENLIKMAQSAADATVSCFTRKSGVESALSLTQIVNFQLNAAFDRLRERNADISCKEGCQYCCCLRVAVFPYEAVAISSYLDSQLPRKLATELKRRVDERASLISNMTEEQHFMTNIECAFLYEGRCSVYSVRPSACAGYHSMSLSKCEYSFNNPTDLITAKPELKELKYFHAAINEGIQQALASLKLDSMKSELHTAVFAITKNL